VAVAARGPDGRIWRVERQWIHRGPRWRKPPKVGDAGADLAGGLFEVGDLDAVAIAVAVVAALLLAWFFVLPALIFLVDLLYLLLVAAIGIALRVLFRRPWNVVAETDGPPAERMVLPVVGFRASGAKVAELGSTIERGGEPLAR
jgi:hypothetical protein